jgi:hypothetical protein
MADKFTERAIKSQRERHEHQIRQCAERIQQYAGYILARLDAGTIPAGFDLVTDAVEINRRIFALEAIKDTTGIYEAEAAEAAGE